MIKEKVDGKVSQWNEGEFKVGRLDEWQKVANLCRVNPFVKNYEYPNLYNYEVWIMALITIYNEGATKYSAAEIKEMENIKTLIENYQTNLPIITTKKRISYSGSSNKPHINQENWAILKKVINIFEMKARKLNDDHGLGTENKQNMSGRSIIR